MKLLRFFLILVLNPLYLLAQIGGDNTYEFLNLSSSARISALGNVLLNTIDNDINLAQQLPSLNHAGMNHQFSANYTNYYAGVNFGSVLYGLPSSMFENICVGLKYINYGDFTRADDFGNVQGDFTAGEYAFYASTALYDNTYRIGATLKGVYSNLDSYKSYGILADLAITYEIKKERMYTSLLMKNAGFQLKTYAEEFEPMPFELLLGISSKLEYAPLRWSVTWAHLEKWDLSYKDDSELIDPLTSKVIPQNISFRDRLLSHLQVGGEFLLSQNFNFRFGYNFRRRQELALDLYKNNVGMSWGFIIKISRFHFNYARSVYHSIGPMHTISVTSSMKQWM